MNYFYWNRGSIMDLDFMFVLKDMFYHNGQQLWEELVMVLPNHKFYIPGWTLRVEIILSFLVPILVWIAKKRIELLYLLLPIFLFVGYDVWTYNLHFALGVIMAYHYPLIGSYNWKESWVYKYRFVLILMVLLMFSIRHIDRMAFENPIEAFLGKWRIDLFQVTGLASAAIIIWSIANEKVQNFLNKRILIFFGEISYGIYLFHWLYVMMVMEHWEILIKPFGYRPLGAIFLLLLVFIATIVSAYLGYELIEKPFIKIGRTSFRREGKQ